MKNKKQSLYTPPKEAYRKPAARLAFALLILTAANALLPFIENLSALDELLQRPIYILLAALCLCTALAVYLKMLLPGGKYHRAGMALLLALELICAFASSVYATVEFVNARIAQLPADVVNMFVDLDLIAAGDIAGRLLLMCATFLLNPFFFLFCASLRKKGSSRPAAVMAGLIFLWSLAVAASAMLSLGTAFLVDLPATIINFSLSACTIVLYWIWPVLHTPIRHSK